jgi:predicted nuclease of restriction endonuclease-like (RecB) superfamily
VIDSTFYSRFSQDENISFSRRINQKSRKTTFQMELIDNKAFVSFVEDVKSKIKAAQYRALQTVNKEQIQLYWDIGQLIVERQQQHGWGKSIVEKLSIELQKNFAEVNGFSARNLWYMRSLYHEYSQSTILQPVVAEIAWTHNILILEKCKDEHRRFFYIEMTRRYSWSKTMLINAIDAKTYENTLINQQNFEDKLPKEQAQNADIILRDEYTFDFLNLTEPYNEAQLEQALIGNIREFLSSMGGDFTFVGNQFGVKVEDKNYEIDLLLYHRGLQCLVAVELKVEEFKPEFGGKMNFYLSALNAYHKKPHENPSIGIIICKSKNRTIVEFALQDIQKPIGVATYTFNESLPKELAQFFPSKEAFIERVENVTNALNKSKNQ